MRLAVCAYALSGPQRFLYNPDSYEYERLAQNLLAGHGFTQASAPPYAPELSRTPLYPALLALVWLTTGHSFTAAILVNIAIGSATVALTYRLALGLFGRPAALAAACLLAADLSTITYSNLLLTEVTFTALLVLGALFLASYLRAAHSLPAFVGGVCLGLATLCRPIGIYLGPALMPLFAWHSMAVGKRQTARDYLLLNAGCFLLVGLWLLRNEMTFGSVDVSSVAAANFYFHRAASVQAALENTDEAAVRNRWQREFDALSAGWSEPQKIAWLNARAAEIIGQHPTTYVRVYAEGLLRMFSPERDSLADLLGWARHSEEASLLVDAGWAQLLPFYVLSILGIWRAFREPQHRSALILFALLCAYFVATAGPETYSRFRVPLMPFLSIFAGFGLCAGRVALPRARARA